MDNQGRSRGILFPPSISDAQQTNLSQAARAVAAAINRLLGSINLELNDSDIDSEDELPNELLFKSNPQRISFTKRLDVLNR